MRTLSSTPDPALAAFAQEPQTVPEFWKQPLEPLPTAAGTDRAVWDLHYARPAGARLSLPMTAIPHGTPAAPQGPLALPGEYTLTLHVNGHSYTRTLHVVNDPRAGSGPAVMAALDALHSLQMKVMAGLAAAHKAFQQASEAEKKLPANSPLRGQIAAVTG
ncbi:MAG: hypothetical protein ACTHJX_06820, partial [Terriglobales bacterium]